MDVLARRQAIREWLDSRPRRGVHQPPHRPVELRAFALSDLDSVNFRRRRLPHWELQHSTYFVTFRAHSTRGRPFAMSGEGTATGRDALIPAAAGIVEESIFFGIETRYDIDAYVVMPDHVHLLITPYAGWPPARILHGLKSVSALGVNCTLARRGSLWQDESFDHLIRGEADWIDKREYILDNPVMGGLVAWRVSTQ